MRTLGFALAAGCCLLAVSVASAQRGAASKISGRAYETPYFYRSAGAYQESAYHHANLLDYTASYDAPVVQELAVEHTAAIRRDIETANQKYAALRPLAKNKPEALKHLDAIDAHHKEVLSHVDAIDKHVADGTGDAAAVKKSAQQAVESLNAAKEAHQNLMKHLDLPKPKAPAAQAN